MATPLFYSALCPCQASFSSAQPSAAPRASPACRSWWRTASCITSLIATSSELLPSLPSPALCVGTRPFSLGVAAAEGGGGGGWRWAWSRARPPYLTTTQCLGLRGCSSTQLFFTSQVENQPPALKLRLPSALSRTPNWEGPRMVAIPIGEGDWGKLLLHRLSAIQGLGHGSLPRS